MGVIIRDSAKARDLGRAVRDLVGTKDGGIKVRVGEHHTGKQKAKGREKKRAERERVHNQRVLSTLHRLGLCSIETARGAALLDIQ